MKTTQDTRSTLRFLVTAVSATLLLVGCERGTVEPPAALPRVGVAEVKRMTLPIVVSTNGTTKAINEVTIRARVKGFLKESKFKEGAYVKKGDLLLTIDEEPFLAKRDQAKAALEEAESTLKKAQQSKAVEMATAQLSLDESTASLAQVESNRERSLYSRKATPLEEVDRRDAQFKRAAAQVAYSKSGLEQAKADYTVNIATAQAKVDEAKAALVQAEIELGYCRMYSPINGRIGELRIKVGNLVGNDSSTELTTIEQLDPITVELHPSSRYLPRITRLIEKGIDVELFVEGQNKHPHKGRVNFLDNKVDTATATVLLKAEVPNPDMSLLPGEFVMSRSVVGEYKDVMVLPERAVLEGQDGFSVFLVNERNIVERVPVKTIDTYQGLTLIESGVSPGQKVIVDGVQLVRRGSKVQAEVQPFGPNEDADVDGWIRTVSPEAGTSPSETKDSPQEKK
jgi:multidrug efflux pump subunit AcrA (membrane-fusion protein)